MTPQLPVVSGADRAVPRDGPAGRTEAVFQSALDLDPESRVVYLRQTCGGDGALREEVEALLAAYHDAETGLPRTALEMLPRGVLEHQEGAWIGRRVGPFHIRSPIDRGAIGIVYEAFQERPRRSVALKVMSRVPSRSLARAFLREARFLARLNHPGIARLYAAGTCMLGPLRVPYLATEFVSGARTLLQFASEEGLRTRARLELFLRVCEAIAHVHGEGILHCDLKPGNILVDRHGTPKLIDFGAARDLRVAVGKDHSYPFAGTLPYTSPEQCGADPRRLDVPSDVYSLGVVLYELLFGRLPYDVLGVSPGEAARIIREESPRIPVPLDPRGNLRAILSGALAKVPERRTASALALSRDLRRHLAGRHVRSRPPCSGG